MEKTVTDGKKKKKKKEGKGNGQKRCRRQDIWGDGGRTRWRNTDFGISSAQQQNVLTRFLMIAFYSRGETSHVAHHTPVNYLLLTVAI